MLRMTAAGILPALALCALMGHVGLARGQTTDGYHAIQVLPVVVDTASFTQRITLRNPEQFPISVAARYYPADGTAQGTPIDCDPIPMTGHSDASVASLRALCPGLSAGSNFGTLVLRSGGSSPFALYSRVSNPAGAGFSVEGFPAHAFTSALSVSTGLRRLAAAPGAPAFQTNCFVGNLADQIPEAQPVTTDVTITLFNGQAALGSTVRSLPPGRLVRLLDVFAAVGAPAGDYDDVRAVFNPDNLTQPGIVAFCTVQDNTSFGADFRIAKAEVSWGFGNVGSQDIGLRRTGLDGFDFSFPGDTFRDFAIPAGASRNIHSLYFRHPDVIGCKLWTPSNQLATAEYGLEMRLLATVNGVYDWTPVAGGNNALSFSGVYLGDKRSRGNGANTNYLLEVESNGQNSGSNRGYKISCESGSGHSIPFLVMTGAPVSF